MSTPSALSNRAIAQYAEMIGESNSVYDENGRADVSGLIRRLGGVVEVADSIFAPEALDVRAHADFTVLLPPFTSTQRDRFTMAHELGHYFLHYLALQKTEPEKFKRGERNRVETQANVFASSLMMPAQQFKRAFDRTGANWEALGDIFDVSARAAQVRAEVLNLI